MPGMEAAGLLCVGVVLIPVAIVSGLFCLSLMRTMSAVAPRNRQIPAGLVWLHMLHLLALPAGLVPTVGDFIRPVLQSLVGVWDIVMVFKIAGSLHSEFRARKIRSRRKDYGRSVGLPWACVVAGVPIIDLAAVILMEGAGVDEDFVMILGLVALFVLCIQLALFIIYWVQIYGYGTELGAGTKRRRRTDEEEDYEDGYRPRRRSRRRDDDDEDEDEDEDESPRARRRRRDDDDEDEDEPPRRRRRVEDDDEDEDRPRRRRRRDEDDD